MELAFTTAGVDKEMLKAIKNGAELLEETVISLGAESKLFRDIYSFIIEICSPNNG